MPFGPRSASSAPKPFDAPPESATPAKSPKGPVPGGATAARYVLGASIVPGQGAQAVRDGDLPDTVSTCHAQTLRGVEWTVTRLKTAAPQVLAG